MHKEIVDFRNTQATDESDRDSVGNPPDFDIR
jgi:hypothetical protein